MLKSVVGPVLRPVVRSIFDGFGIGNSFSPASFFANGEQGWWYDPSNFATLFQDNAGTTPVTAVEQPVGLQLDLSKGLVLGSELVTNGDFATDTWWTKGPACTISGGSANFAGSFGYVLYRNSVSGIAVGGVYEVTFTVTNYVSGSIRPYLGTTPTFGTAVSANGTYTTRFGPAAGAEVGFNSASAFTGSIDNVSIKQVTGNHRFQTTSANRPVVSARVNLLTKTEDFGDAAWTKSGATVTANAITAPNGTLTADKIVETATTASHGINQAATFTVAVSFRAAVYVKAAERNFAKLSVSGGAAGLAVAVNLTTGALSAVVDTFGNYTGITAAALDVGDGWWLVSLTATRASGGSDSGAVTIGASDALTASGSYAGDATKGIYSWGADLRPTNQGVGLPAYQRVNTSTDYDSTGFPIYIKPNGSNQFMVTNSINFSATDKMTVWQGVRKLSDASTSIIAELSTNYAANRQAFAVIGRDTGGYGFGSGGSNITSADVSTGYAAPITNVLTGIGDISGDVCTLRLNGAQVATSTADQGTGNFGTYPAYFYMRAGTSLPFNGNDYGSIARGAASTAAQITAGETYINSLTKAYAP